MMMLGQRHFAPYYLNKIRSRNMNDTILFSPIGGTDPISMNNCHDGAMLHICRVYKPTKIFLYMSQEMLKNQEADDRYRYAMGKLFELQGRKDVKIIQIERPELQKVHEFDFFYQDFREIIEQIMAGMDETDRLLINISSGTPAMKSGLLVLQTLGEFPAVTVQVATPEEKMNEHTHIGYDIELLWELDEDNDPNFKNRCQEVHCPTLSKIKNEEIIKKHIAVYDYQAAAAVAETMKPEDTEKYMGLLKMAAARILLDFPAVDQWIRETGFDCLPVKAGNSRKYFEYALNLSIKLKRGEYTDFIRGITPIIVDLFEIALKKQCRIDVRDYTRKKDGISIWDRSKLNGTKVGQVLDGNYAEGLRSGPVYSDHIRLLIAEYSQDAQMKKLADELRDVEKAIRNRAAHEIVSITDEKIKELTGFTGKQIMDKLIRFFVYTGMGITADSWKSYDRLNQKILSAMM